MYCVTFVENALFKRSSDICQRSLPSSLLDELSMDKRDSNGFLSRRLVCRSGDRSYNSTNSSLSHSRLSTTLLALKFDLNLLIWHTHGTATYYIIACN